MRSRAPLVLMEQIVMLLVFALASALCLQAFSKSDQISRRGEETGKAAVICQTTAEVIRSYGGDVQQALSSAAAQLEARYDQGILWVEYDENWNPGGKDAYRLTARSVESSVEGMNTVCVAMVREDETLFEINVAWQGELGGNSP